MTTSPLSSNFSNDSTANLEYLLLLRVSTRRCQSDTAIPEVINICPESYFTSSYWMTFRRI